MSVVVLRATILSVAISVVIGVSGKNKGKQRTKMVLYEQIENKKEL